MVKASHEGCFFLVGQVESHSSESIRELTERDNGVTVFVKLGEEIDDVFLERGVSTAGLLNLAEDVLNSGLRELVGVIVHVLLGVVISGEKLELESSEEDSATDEEVLLRVVGLGNGREMFLLLHEFTSHTSRVFVTDFVNLDGIISTEEGDNELTGFIIRLSRDEFGVESEDVHVLLEHLLHVDLGGLSSEVEDTVHGVFLSSVSSVRGDSLVDKVRSGLAEGLGVLGDSHVALVPFLSEGITVVDSANSSVDFEVNSTHKVLRQVEFFFSERHAGAVSENRLLGELLSLEEHREGVASRVLLGDLLNLARVVGEEVVKGIVLNTTVVGLVIPEDGEGEDLSVVLEERVEVSVGTATTKSDFIVVLHLTCIWRILFEVNHSASLLVRIIGKAFGVTESDTFVSVEGLGEFITVVNAEDSGVNIKVHRHVKVRPGVALRRASVFGYLVSLKEDTLGESSVLLSVLNDVDGVVIKVVHHSALVDSEVLLSRFNNGLLEVAAESQDLSIVLKPLGSDLRDGIVLMGGACRHSRVGHSGSETHGIEHFLVDGLGQALCLF